MVYLHEDRGEFRDAIYFTANRTGYTPAIIEKDYYVTLVLRGLAERLPFIVFKGGTSLSKCHGAIRRFSEDIDVTTDEHLGDAKKRRVKKAVKEVAEAIGMTIPNLDETQSRLSFNRYVMAYDAVTGMPGDAVQPAIYLETSYAEESFPNVVMPVHSYIGDALGDDAAEFGLGAFDMKVQGIDRTLVDKVFAICDYYMKGEVRRHSRHIYDIYKLVRLVPMDDGFRRLVGEVRGVRSKNARICLSAQPGVDVPEVLRKLTADGAYRDDYETLTERILEERVPYETAVGALGMVAGMFGE